MNYFNQESDRLFYRPLTEDDSISWEEFFQNNDRLSYLGIDLKREAKIIAKEWVLKQLERYQKEGLGHLAVIEKVSGKFIGMGGILLRDQHGKKHFEIAYSLKPAFWGKGYATEIARQMRLFGKQQGIAGSFISIIHKENKDSINVAVKNEMYQVAETVYLEMPVYIYSDSESYTF